MLLNYKLVCRSDIGEHNQLAPRFYNCSQVSVLRVTNWDHRMRLSRLCSDDLRFYNIDLALHLVEVSCA
jgi:hypothetical protein